MSKKVKGAIALALSLVMIVCSIPFVSSAAEVNVVISANATNGVADSDVSFSYMVVINGSPYNGIVKGSDGKSYTVSNGILALPMGVAASIAAKDGDSYSVQRLAFSNGRYKPIDESEVQSGTISTTAYYVTVDGNKTEIGESENNAMTNNGADTTLVLYTEENGTKHRASEVSAVNGYQVIRKAPAIGSVTYSIEEYSGFALTESVEQHEIVISDVTCTHTRPLSYGYSNSLTGYYDGVAGEAKTGSASTSVSLNAAKTACNDKLKENTLRAYYDSANAFAEVGMMGIVKTNDVAGCQSTVTSLSRNQSVTTDYINPVVENELIAFTAVSEKTFEYSAQERENPSAICSFDVEPQLYTATLTVNVANCEGGSISGVAYTVVDEKGSAVTIFGNNAQVPYGSYSLIVYDIPEDCVIDYQNLTVNVVSEDETYSLDSVYHIPYSDLVNVK